MLVKAKEIGRDLAGSALDAAVRALFDVSWGQARDLVRRGKVTLDGETVVDPLRRVRAGGRIVVDPAARKARPEDVLLPATAIVHVDAHVVVVDKPTGVASVPYDPAGMGASIARRARPGEDPALDELVRAVLARRYHGGPLASLGVVHRIDKETSGLVVFTRTWLAKKKLMQAFRSHAVHRRYLALVHGRPRTTTHRSHLVADRGDGLRGSVEKRRGRARGLPGEKTQLAVTHVEVLERFGSAAAGVETALVSCRLETGRTHQIRIHLAEAGCPLLGERVYVRGRESPLVPAPRLMLHASELGFVHPATEREMRWTSVPPSDFQEILAFVRGV